MGRPGGAGGDEGRAGVSAAAQRAMAAEAEAARNARAKEGEHKASRALRHAADVITDCPAAHCRLDSFGTARGKGYCADQQTTVSSSFNLRCY